MKIKDTLALVAIRRDIITLMTGDRSPMILSPKSQHGKLLAPMATRRRENKATTHSDLPRASRHIHGNCVNAPVVTGRLTRSTETK